MLLLSCPELRGLQSKICGNPEIPLPGHPGFPTEPRPHKGRQWVLQTACLVASLASNAHSWGSICQAALPLCLMTDHFFLAGPLGPGHLYTRSRSFRSKNSLAFSQKQNTPVLPMATLLKGGTQTTLATQMLQPRLPGVWLLSEDKSALFTHGYCLAEPMLAAEDAHLRIPRALWTHMICSQLQTTVRPWGPERLVGGGGREAGLLQLLLGPLRKPLLLSGQESLHSKGLKKKKKSRGQEAR